MSIFKKKKTIDGITCPECGQFHKFNPNPIVLVDCIGGKSTPNHSLLQYDRDTKEWKWYHNNLLYGGMKDHVIGYVVW